MSKETKEFLNIPAGLVDGTYKSLEDGSFQPLTDFLNYLPALTSIQPGLDGIGLMAEENALMPIPERAALQEHMVGKMPNVPADERYDIADGVTGLLSWFRLFWRRGFRRGEQATLAAIREKYREGTLNVYLDSLEE